MNDQRLAPAFRKNDSARLGAAIAFQQSRPPSNVKFQSSAATAAVFASRMNRHETQRDESEGPEIGSVKDKIERFGSNSLAPPTFPSTQGRSRTPSLSRSPAPKSPARSPGPEKVAAHLAAARLAAEKSPGRKQEPPIDAARIGAVRSASRAQSQQPQPQPRSTPVRHELRSPLPVRPTLPADNSVDRMINNAIDQDPSNGRPPSVRSHTGTVRSQATSPQPSVSSRISIVLPDEVKPKIPPLPSRSTASSRASIPKTLHTPSPLRPTPSMVSISGLSHNSSSSGQDETGVMNEEALSNAIVASSLASARASPMPKAPPPPPRRRRARSLLALTHSPKSDLSRTPSPPKGMPMTLRGIPKDGEADPNRRHKKHLLHKHPHKHHEGDRKRWRREVTEKERKRYEGVWASNKGLLIPPELKLSGTEKWPPPSEMVLNLVVREIWSRSRLPSAVLEQVWTLVDHQKIGLLTKDEFVVGMWLIDQQLKGRKLPVNVPDSVWDSVRYVTGIKLSSIGKG
ncbi:hypothetical protein N7520_011240 [Penicillium odoratum]|uniref:uncharacterized protein n=1 Tax=Penicillium odoratum TaxID=1167516 RepID=UPI0025499B3C|nr:uncharacterized protein N7520_011240 [Penicillium odoratum]KAJ5746058.1 hypothetical protein N7520_011240 [Penicillium odoratum]